MWISDRMACFARLSPRLRELEALALAVLSAFLPEMAWGGPGIGLEPHPGWIGVVLVAVRYGIGGFLAGLAATTVAMGAGSAIAGAGFSASWTRLDSGPNLLAMGACLIVSWIAARQHARQADLQERLLAVSDRALDAERTARELRRVVRNLRARVDRASASLSFLREVAARLEGSDPVAASEAAADLALVRTGASTVAVTVGTGEFQRTLAFRDVGAPCSPARRQPQHADLSAPIRVGSYPIGSISLWGLPEAASHDATVHDLMVIASWCGPALASVWRPGVSAARALEAHA